MLRFSITHCRSNDGLVNTAVHRDQSLDKTNLTGGLRELQ